MRDATLERLGREPTVSLATFRRDGRTVETPVWIAEHAGRLFVFTEARSGKVKRLRNDPSARLTPCSFRGVLRGTPVAARAAVLEDPGAEAAAYAAFERKYGWQMKLTNWLSRLAGRIDGRAMLVIDVDEAAP